MERDEIPARPAAIRSWAPYGMKPCTRHEKVSRMLATLRGSRPKRAEISLAMVPDVMMAMVLLAVQMFERLTRAAMLNSAPLLPFIFLVRPRVMKSRPPFDRIISSIPPAISVTMIRSLMLVTPFPIACIQPVHVRRPLPKPIKAVIRRPVVSTIDTSSPIRARIMIRRYGIISITSTLPGCGMLSTESPINTYRPQTIRAAGPTMRMLVLNLSFIVQPWVRVAAMVVSDMNERLSPKKAPPTTIAVIKAVKPGCAPIGSSFPAISAPIGTSAAIVPTLVPMDMEMKHAAMNRPA